MSSGASGARPRRWAPGVHRAAQRNVAEAIYGLILATSVIAVTRKYEPGNAGVTAATVIVTATVFWLAHVYAGLLAVGVRDHRAPGRDDLRLVVDDHWPLVQAGILPTALLLLGPLGILDDATAQDVAVAACLAELTAIGILAALAAGARGIWVVLSAAVSLSLGGCVIILKVLVH